MFKGSQTHGGMIQKALNSNPSPPKTKQYCKDPKLWNHDSWDPGLSHCSWASSGQWLALFQPQFLLSEMEMTPQVL
jgi:hypothetical protein